MPQAEVIQVMKEFDQAKDFADITWKKKIFVKNERNLEMKLGKNERNLGWNLARMKGTGDESWELNGLWLSLERILSTESWYYQSMYDNRYKEVETWADLYVWSAWIFQFSKFLASIF